MLKAAGNSELLTFTDSNCASCEETKKADLEPAFSFVIRWFIENQGNKITSQEVPQKLSLMLCFRE
jgi:hypothetical protein